MWKLRSWAQWLIFVVLALGRLRQEDSPEFQISLN